MQTRRRRRRCLVQQRQTQLHHQIVAVPAAATHCASVLVQHQAREGLHRVSTDALAVDLLPPHLLKDRPRGL